MRSRFGLAVLLLVAALAILALVAMAWFYRSLLPGGGSGLPEGGCGFLLVSATLFVAFLGGAVWLFVYGDDA